MKTIIRTGHPYGDIAFRRLGENEWSIEQGNDCVFLAAPGLSRLSEALSNEERKSEDDWMEESDERILS